MTYADIALRQIEDAELSATEYRAARRLLDLAQHSAGVVRLEPDDAVWLCSVTSWAAARRILAAIDAAGVVTCQVCGAAVVAFVAWPGGKDAPTKPPNLARIDVSVAWPCIASGSVISLTLSPASSVEE